MQPRTVGLAKSEQQLLPLAVRLLRLDTIVKVCCRVSESTVYLYIYQTNW